MQDQKAISRTIIKAEEKERNRIGAELHDNVNQLIFAARLYIGLERKNSSGSHEHLDKADEHLSVALEEIRQLAHSLTTSVVINEGLVRCVEEIGRMMLELKGIWLFVDISDEAVELLSAEQQLMLYRIIQEQTSNILKYADTTEASLSLATVDNEAELIISDNGKGFDKTEQKLTGIGFSNIFNRVDAYNGKMEVTSSPGNGCKLIVRFPIKE